ncbi:MULTISPECIES: acyl carrier protein [unclassified Clostridioides]|uniref:acyl carrier protein n=1 Tax=unclassified Clostridioides TaxID=2635829 RepID=UPI001D10E6FD|nr:acyl carrier protein [Clostridioides sp. ZZV15-6388]MCC0644612.1 acyl carrier protein [Clostridioides sp. ZZV14-6150]MCC0659806.1 acyl carrier protein [Clostridioides sp. ZZV14-6154]MCC0666087.1 acyl carrier protein [Clostridioides sp. ZZV15-6597]MCC0666679.1 acyl carrier protein [Clostridioides sp. ZZV14-6153]MCC0717701.1 acyl carrier protein [Clostridioides sp. ZZV14-6105]MCC0722730.1 acyl carrier protein [Clostridioides sp. ZZV14-6104]MCC0725396.1 acyl carrier protein [Clostridioides s
MFNKVVAIIIEQLGVEDKEITMETSLMKDLEADSLDAVEIIMALEDEFGIEIPDTEAENFKSIGDIVNYIEANK